MSRRTPRSKFISKTLNSLQHQQLRSETFVHWWNVSFKILTYWLTVVLKRVAGTEFITWKCACLTTPAASDVYWSYYLLKSKFQLVSHHRVLGSQDTMVKFSLREINGRSPLGTRHLVTSLLSDGCRVDRWSKVLHYTKYCSTINNQITTAVIILY